MQQSLIVFVAALIYIGLLFLVASYGDKLRRLPRARMRLLVYPLSLAVYCTSWTFFGSVGLATRSGAEFGFQSVHRSPLVNDRFSLVYSCAVRENGDEHGRPIGVLGIVFNWEALAQTIVKGVSLTDEEKQMTRVCIVDDSGRVLADSSDRILGETIEFGDRGRLFAGKKDYTVSQIGDQICCIAHASSPGFETYATGWHSLLIQEQGKKKRKSTSTNGKRRTGKSEGSTARTKRRKKLARV